MSPMEGGTMPKPSEQAKAAFTKLVPDGPAVTLRPMFGNLAAFVNGNMFAGLFGEDLFVRLPEDESDKVRQQGGRDFAPMAGRPMKGYVTVPGTWRDKPAAIKGWIATALEVTGKMPAKVPAAKKPK
jgi:TfoX/Sxy family transcriptional regulator of competence genes